MEGFWISLKTAGDAYYFLAGEDWTVCAASRIRFLKQLLRKSGFHRNLMEISCGGGKLFTYRRLALCDGWIVSCTETSNLFEAADIFRFFIFVILILTGIAMLLVTGMLSRSINRPFQQLLWLFGKVEEGSLDVQTDYAFRDEFVVIFEQFDRMLKPNSTAAPSERGTGKRTEGSRIQAAAGTYSAAFSI